MRILLCNDDGFEALGILTLARHLREQQHEVFVVAPSEERSGQSHAMTFFRRIPTRRVDDTTWAVQGTPGDCAALALHHFLKSNPPELVISGINHGLNVGWDVNYSGTVGAATEAALLGFKAIAVSVDLRPGTALALQQDAFDRAAQLTCKIVARHEELVWTTHEILNINHPGVEVRGVVQAACAGYNMHVPQIITVEPDVFMMGGSVRVNRGDPSQDVTAVQEGYAALSFVGTRQSSPSLSHSLDAVIESLKTAKD
ncbi:MAG TPA: 5'/3'-nucleotidase SurE [Oligoflexus sp.]|uniref:5'/3'-nucleotidase SurE n=1 Tax=Oligoflexus sp. TaxID=1971216 RepID=UPI002D7E69FE|nr:5'/3'-nucleotidase SurE [Oligoflexus sp.]HET9241604.1 5'/3'-nucleotidase SurE [Oligoflexus sp.]